MVIFVVIVIFFRIMRIKIFIPVLVSNWLITTITNNHHHYHHSSLSSITFINLYDPSSSYLYSTTLHIVKVLETYFGAEDCEATEIVPTVVTSAGKCLYASLSSGIKLNYVYLSVTMNHGVQLNYVNFYVYSNVCMYCMYVCIPLWSHVFNTRTSIASY